MVKKYIAFFDLLGTKGACENPELYYNNICSFEKAIKDTSWLLKNNEKNYGKVGVFSDSAYAESNDLQYLLDFLVCLRNRLMSENLFFNAVVKKGELGVDPISQINTSVAFGVSFKKSDIAALYIAQTNFKGIGIFLDPSVHNDVSSLKTYKMNDCIYIAKKSDNSSIAIPYKDIAFGSDTENKKILKELMRVIIRTMYSSYMRSQKFGSYYISLLSNILRSYTKKFDWDLSKHEFSEAPTPFQMVQNMIINCYNDISDLPGIEYLALILLDIVYNSEDLYEAQKKDITMQFINYECVKKYWLHALNEIPNSIFSPNLDKCHNNREIFINYCQNEISDIFMNKIVT